jgi:group I intron endonuclease
VIVYIIINIINGKQYVGQTTKSLVVRWRRHCWYSEHKKRMPISNAIHKYGKDSFTIVEICRCSSIEELNEKEIYYAKLYNTFAPNQNRGLTVLNPI